MGTKLEFGRVCGAKEVWPREVDDMTPWVVENLQLIGAKLDLHLRHVGCEAPLGSFRADILAETDAGRTVVIENQFGPTDHEHFAKILLYAIEAKADVAIWISTDPLSWRGLCAVRGEHVRALKRLNGVFAGAIEFYAIGISFESDPVPVGTVNPPITPRLHVVVRPNPLRADAHRR